MTNTHRPDPARIAQLVETDELVRYVVEELDGQITAIQELRTPPVISTRYLERRQVPTWKPVSLPSPLSSRQH